MRDIKCNRGRECGHLASCVKEAIFVRDVLRSLQLDVGDARLRVYKDNKGSDSAGERPFKRSTLKCVPTCLIELVSF